MAGEWRIAGIDVPAGTRALLHIELTELPDGSRVKLPWLGSRARPDRLSIWGRRSMAMRPMV